MINLAYEVWFAIDGVHRRLAAPAELLAECNLSATVVDSNCPCHRYAAFVAEELFTRQASTRVLSSSVFSLTRGDDKNVASDCDNSWDRPSSTLLNGANRPLKNGSCAVCC